VILTLGGMIVYFLFKALVLRRLDEEREYNHLLMMRILIGE